MPASLPPTPLIGAVDSMQLLTSDAQDTFANVEVSDSCVSASPPTTLFSSLSAEASLSLYQPRSLLVISPTTEVLGASPSSDLGCLDDREEMDITEDLARDLAMLLHDDATYL